MEEFFENLHLSDLFTAYHPSFRSLTYEFLSSLHEGLNKNNKNALIFRLKNKTYSTTFDQLAEIFGLPTTKPLGRGESKTTTPLDEVWLWATGKYLSNYSHLYATEVQHPLLRLFFKFSRECLFASPNSHQVRQTDLYLLASYLNPNPGCVRYMPGALYKHFLSVALGRGTQAICIGGLITRIATRFGYDFDNSVIPDSLFDYDHLHRTKCIKPLRDVVGPYIWIVSPTCSFNLFFNASDLPPIFPKPSDPKAFLLEDPSGPVHIDSDEDDMADLGAPSSPQRATNAEPTLNQPSQGFNSMEAPQWFTDAMGHVHSSLGQLQLDIREIRGEFAHLRERQDQLWEDHRRFQREVCYPLYDHAFHSGWVRPNAPIPSWYEPPPQLPHYIYGSSGAGGSGAGGNGNNQGGSGSLGGFGFNSPSGGDGGGAGRGSGDGGGVSFGRGAFSDDFFRDLDS